MGAAQALPTDLKRNEVSNYESSYSMSGISNGDSLNAFWPQDAAWIPGANKTPSSDQPPNQTPMGTSTGGSNSKMGSSVKPDSKKPGRSIHSSPQRKMMKKDFELIKSKDGA